MLCGEEAHAVSCCCGLRHGTACGLGLCSTAESLLGRGRRSRRVSLGAKSVSDSYHAQRCRPAARVFRCRGWGVGLMPPHLLPPTRVLAGDLWLDSQLSQF